MWLLAPPAVAGNRWAEPESLTGRGRKPRSIRGAVLRLLKERAGGPTNPGWGDSGRVGGWRGGP